MAGKGANGSDIGILVVCHGSLGEEFIEAAKLICQCPIKNARALTIKADYDREKVRGLLVKSLAKLGRSSRRVLVLCDAKGATASRLIDSGINGGTELQCVYGLNLPMLMECINFRSRAGSLEELAEGVCAAGRDSIRAGDMHSSGDGH